MNVCNSVEGLAAAAEAAYRRKDEGPEQADAWYSAEGAFFTASAGESAPPPDWGTPDEMATVLRNRRIENQTPAAK
jgi:hypothetical protein